MEIEKDKNLYRIMTLIKKHPLTTRALQKALSKNQKENQKEIDRGTLRGHLRTLEKKKWIIREKKKLRGQPTLIKWNESYFKDEGDKRVKETTEDIKKIKGSKFYRQILRYIKKNPYKSKAQIKEELKITNQEYYDFESTFDLLEFEGKIKQVYILST